MSETIMKYQSLVHCASMSINMVRYFAMKAKRPLTQEEKIEISWHEDAYKRYNCYLQAIT